MPSVVLQQGHPRTMSTSVVTCGQVDSGRDEVAMKETGSIEIGDLYSRLNQLIDGAVLPESAASSSRKLSRLTIGQLGELLNDVVDEMDRRRDAHQQPFLEINLQYSSKRNQARQKLADLPESRLLQLVHGVKVEIESRFPTLRSLKECELGKKFTSLSQSINSLLKDNQSEGELLESPLDSGKGTMSMATPCTPMSLTDAFMPVNVRSSDDTAKGAAADSGKKLALEGFQDQQLLGLDSLIEELNMIVGMEHQSEAEKMKMKYEVRNKELLEKLGHFEEEVIPVKNHEIAALTAKVDDFEARLNLCRREHSECHAMIESRDKKIEEQARLIAALQESHEELQRRLRTIAATDMTEKTVKRPESTINYLLERAGLFTSQWNNFIAVHKKALEVFISEDVSLAEKLTCLSAVSVVMQKLIKNVEALTAKINISKMAWIQGDVENLLLHRTKCLQHLSFCVVCCKDMKSGGMSLKVASNKVVEVLKTLSLDCRQLIDSAELIISRGQIPCSPSLLSSQSTLDVSAACTPTPPESMDIALLVRNGADRIISTCRSLIVLVEDFRGPPSQEIIEFSPQLRQNLADSLTRTIEITQKANSFLNQALPSESMQQMKGHIEMVSEAAKKLQHCIANGSGIFADEKSRCEVKNSCRVLSLALTELSRTLSLCS